MNSWPTSRASRPEHSWCKVIAGVLAATAPASALEPAEVFRQARTGVVAITVHHAHQKEALQGSGVLVSPVDVVTNCHIVRQAIRIEVRQGEVTQDARLRYRDLERNLCQVALRAPLPGVTAITRFGPSTELEIGQSVFAVSSPQGDSQTFVRGMISGLKKRPGESADLIQSDVTVPAGSSGGGLFDANARLIGILTAGLTDTQNLSIILPAQWVLDLPKRNVDRIAAGEEDAVSVAPTDRPSQPVQESIAAVWRPMVGERWVYRMRERGRDVGKIFVEIAHSSATRIKERITREGYNAFRHEREIDARFDPSRFHTAVSLPGGYQLLELSPYLPPGEKLQVGKTWREVGGEIRLNIIGTRTAIWTLRVAGQESVTVPAGRFTAWKIEAVSDPLENRTRIECAYWYAPDMTRAIKTRIKIVSNFIALNGEESYELVTFVPSKAVH